MQSRSFWTWAAMLVIMALAIVFASYHLGSGQTVPRPELSSRSSLEDIRSTVNRNTQLLGTLQDTMGELSDQHKWLLGLLITTLVGIVLELAKHYIPQRK